MAWYCFVKGFRDECAAREFLDSHDLCGDVYSILPRSDTRELYRLFSAGVSRQNCPVLAVWMMDIDDFFVW